LCRYVVVMLSGLLTKRIELPALTRNWSVSFLGNFIGSVLMAYLAFGANTAAAPAVKVGLFMCSC
jgi:formate/nitrite transporter FocA (FNT family)